MRLLFRLGFLPLVAVISSAAAQVASPPVAPRESHTIHGIFGDRNDPWFWLSDRTDKRVTAYLEAENTYTEKMMSGTSDLQNQLFNEMVSRIKEDDTSVPYKKGDFYYYVRSEKGLEYPVYCRKKNSLSAPEEIIIDGNELVKGHAFLNFDLQMSPDQSKACVIMDVHGRNFYTIRILDLNTRKWLQDEIENTRNGCEWTSDSKAIVYAVPDKKTLRVFQVRKHVLGTPQKKDILLLQEDDETLNIYVYKSRSEQYIFADAERTDASVIRYADAGDPQAFKIIQPLVRDMYYMADHAEGDAFMIRTNLNAVNYRLCSAPVSQPDTAHWKDIIPHRENVMLSGVQFFSSCMVAEEMENGLTRLRVLRPGRKDIYIQFEEPAYYAVSGYNPAFDAEGFRYLYASMITPFTTYEFNFQTEESAILKQEEVPGGYKKELYATERIMVPARDGKQIPMSVVYRRDLFTGTGNAPGFIYGYGAYGYNNEDYFDSNIISLLDRGFVYANTHIRGGQEMGGDWYEEGKMLHKLNTFFDFIDCSIWLIENKYVAADKLFANGGSAGGLLMGAVCNMRPDLYRGIIADVPFVDVITTMEDASIPLTTFEWLEWGNPEIKDQYDYMMQYSPYDNVNAKAYPNMLVTTGFNDSQVQYFEPAKWVAKLRYTKTDDNLLLFKINMDAGHGGQSGRYESIRETAFMYAFILHVLETDK